MAAKNVETLGSQEVISKALESLNPGNAGPEWVFSEISVDGAVNSAIFSVSKTLGLNASDNDTMQLVIALVSYGALAEVGHQILGIGSGLGLVRY